MGCHHHCFIIATAEDSIQINPSIYNTYLNMKTVFRLVRVFFEWQWALGKYYTQTKIYKKEGTCDIKKQRLELLLVPLSWCGKDHSSFSPFLYASYFVRILASKELEQNVIWFPKKYIKMVRGISSARKITSGERQINEENYRFNS